jgi:hypothetical protein
MSASATNTDTIRLLYLENTMFERRSQHSTGTHGRNVDFDTMKSALGTKPDSANSK